MITRELYTDFKLKITEIKLKIFCSSLTPFDVISKSKWHVSLKHTYLKTDICKEIL